MKEVVTSRKRILTSEQVQQLRSVCETITPGGKRDLAILDSMLYQGMRLREVANLRLEHIRRSGDQFIIHIEGRSKPVKAHASWLQSLNDWLEQRGVSLENNRGPIFVQSTKFVESTRKSLGKRTISYLVAKYGNLAGIAPMKGPDRLFPGDLRRTCARNAYDRGARLLSITAFLGFNHLESTARFIDALELQDANAGIELIKY
jgi:site-specific recombinase XerD